MSTIDPIWDTGKILLLLSLLFYNGQLVSAEGNIGCLFAETLCVEHAEWCYDDFAFGKCLPQYGLEPEDLLRNPLTEEESGLLATMLEDLQGALLGWEHPFVQCRMQGSLNSIRNKAPIPASLCEDLVPDPEILGPQSPLAFVRFTPPNDEFADEVYYPPATKKAFDDRFYVNPLQEKDVTNEAEPIESILAKSEMQSRRNELRKQIEIRNLLEEQPISDYYSQQRVNSRVMDVINANFNRDNQVEDDGLSHLKERQNLQKADDILNLFQHSTNEKKSHLNGPAAAKPHTLTSFREISRDQHVPLDSTHYKLENDQPSNYQSNKFFVDSTNNELPANTQIANNLPSAEAGVYTEGGLVYVPEGSDEKKDQPKEKARDLLRDIMGFTRHERLDVKKPGPPAAPPPSSDIEHDTHKEVTNKEVLPEHIRNGLVLAKKEVLMDHAGDDNHGPYSVDTEYTHVILKNPIDSWATGSRIVTAIGEMLHIKLSHIRVDIHEISFRVEPNSEKKTAYDVAKQINDTRFKNNLQRRLGIIVIRAGVGDKTKEIISSVSAEKLDEEKSGPDVTHVIAYMFAGAGAAAVVVIIVTFFLIKKHDKKRDKLGGLQSGIVGAESCSKDYSDLCRARMAGKGNTADTPSGRIASLSKESDARPPSSRSSTSSWSEEPALTNMDISTGHMVLAYMEDHLKNKGRLRREWEALCRYEAEPSARDAAVQPQCAALNRSGAPLPYDHSRVVLNHLTNAEGMDYINASTITDHDPRAPAYVAAQGPQGSTLAHFWQMIWEQGAVVIVALCRLQENGQISCARYWPEEGSEVFHIYEVHLVSEHIWCDDYLVRSFYLKNLRTGETRTVTQFHFLSWPQAGVPATTKALLEFRRKVNKSYRGRSCPVVVHSSNGAGRTGAYILLDLVLARMNKGAREIDIAATLEHLRDQRVGLVATRQQFEFVLMAVAEEVHVVLKNASQIQNEKRDLEKEKEKESTIKENSEIEAAGRGKGTSENEGEGKSKDEGEIEGDGDDQSQTKLLKDDDKEM